MSELTNELTEEEVLTLYQTLSKYAEKLSAGSSDRADLLQLMAHLENRLKEIAWNKYRTEKAIQ